MKPDAQTDADADVETDADADCEAVQLGNLRKTTALEEETEAEADKADNADKADPDKLNIQHGEN